MIEASVNAMSGEFTLTRLEHTCSGVNRDMIRRVLRGLQKTGLVECLGRGPGATWRKRGNKEGNMTPNKCKRLVEEDLF